MTTSHTASTTYHPVKAPTRSMGSPYAGATWPSPTAGPCIGNASLEIVQRCPVQKEAFIYYDNCLLWYSNEFIFRAVSTKYVCALCNGENATSVTEFNQVLREQMDGLRSRAAAGNSTRKFSVNRTAAPDFRTLYGLAQCTPDLSELQCSDCLDSVIGDLPNYCGGKIGGRVVVTSCNVRYEVYRFYDPSASPPSAPPPPPTPNTTSNSAEPPSNVGGSSNTDRAVIMAVVAIGAVFLLAAISVFCIIYRRRKAKLAYANIESMDEIRTAETLQYDFATIRDSTDNFSEENKLGQGGFGPVYKGKLPNGQEIAVKRLLKGLGQGHQEFKNEVLLVARLQHHNLVRLLVFCLSGQERLLIYEFLPNSSLDRFIFDPVRRQQLDWQSRQKIIGGIARGLVYLHEDSQLRVIHRDLKASNVLLDKEMVPKISDFGMARLFVVEETHAATSRIVGTYGYMAPEYALYGQFSIKSDVFSFGILVLEIVSGQKNNHFISGETVQDLLSFAWRN